MEMDNYTTANGTLLSTQILENASNIMAGAEGLGVGVGMNLSQPPEMDIAIYLKIALLCVVVVVGTIGNIMVTLVISCSRDMRTSTNIFLVNLSIADLLVLVVCTPTALVEVTYQNSDVWVMGYFSCKLVPLLEATVANGSVLTILAISCERYYVICRPLRANYVCTKSRAALISLCAWILGTIVTSPMYFMISFHTDPSGEMAKCTVETGVLWMDAYTISTIVLLFFVPVGILLVMYGMIAHRLTMDRSSLSLNAKNENYKARKQVVIMLGTVVFTFFLCLLPFRVLTLVYIFADYSHFVEYASFYGDAVYVCRVMVYINSALNPILYNIMSSKFRNGFLRLCHRKRKPSPFSRHGTFLTNTTTSTTNASINLGHNHGNGFGNGYGNGHPGGSPEFTASLIRKNGVSKLDQHTLNKYIHNHMNGNLKNLNMNGTVIATNPNSPPDIIGQNSPNKSRNCSIKTLSGNGCGKFRTSFTSSVKSNSVYSAYIPGNNKSETVL